MEKITTEIGGVEYEVIPVMLSSTVPDDDFNIRCLLEALTERVKARKAIEIERGVTNFGEVSTYTVVVLKEVNRGG